MADFQTGAELSVSVNQSSLSDARDTIQSELGDLEVGVEAVVNGGGGGPSGGRSEMENLVQIETERWELDKVRNNYLEQLAETSVLPGGGQQAGGGGGTTILGGTGLLSSIGLGGATSALGGGGALAGAFGLNELIGARGGGEVLGRAAAQSGGNPAQFGAQAGVQIGRSIGLGEEAQSAIENFGQNIDVPDLAEQSWPELPPLADEADWPMVPDLSAETDWPSYNDLSEETDWPSLPSLSEEFEWPKPDFDLNPFNDGKQQPANTARATNGLPAGGPDGEPMNVDPTINFGGITVDVVTEIDSAVDDAVDEVEDTVDDAVGDLERRVADAIGGFFR